MPKALIELREKTIKAINESSDKQAFIYKMRNYYIIWI